MADKVEKTRTPGIQKRWRQRKDGSYGEPHYRAQTRLTSGKRVSKSFPRLQDAKEWLTTIQGSKLDGTAVDPAKGRTLHGEWMDRWMAARRHTVRPSTLARDESYLENHVRPKWGEWQLADIERMDVKEWIGALSDQGLAPATVRKVYQLFRATMEEAVTERCVGVSPCRDLSRNLPKDKNEPMRILTPGEVRRLADAIDPRYRALVLVLAFGGLRIGEAAALTTDRVNLAKRQLHVVQTVSWVKYECHVHEPKTAQGRRKVGLPGPIAKELATHLAHLKAGEEFPLPEGRERKPYQRLSFAPKAAESGLVFPSLEGDYLQPSAFRRRQFAAAVKEAGLDGLRIHDLRHTAVSLWIASGADMKRIAERAGHASASFTIDRYGQLMDDSEDDLMDALGEGWLATEGAEDNVVSIR